MRTLLAFLLSSAAPLSAVAQSARLESASTVTREDWHVTLTLFRSPGTGLQVSRGRIAAFVAHYPTVIQRAGARRTMHFARVGAAAYARPHARTSPYASASLAPSRSKGWSNSGIVDLGVRQRMGTRYSAQLGAAVLHAPQTGDTRVNPTAGLGVRF